MRAGLVHVSEMSASRVENASEIVDVGEHVWIKVIGREVTSYKLRHKHTFWRSAITVITAVSCVCQIQGEKVKLSFSMKAVNQGTGRDLDPNNVIAEYAFHVLSVCLHRRMLLLNFCCVCSQDLRRRRQFRDQTSNKITLEAVLNTTCSKCGCKGTKSTWQISFFYISSLNILFFFFKI